MNHQQEATRRRFSSLSGNSVINLGKIQLSGEFIVENRYQSMIFFSTFSALLLRSPRAALRLLSDWRASLTIISTEVPDG